MYVYVFSKVIVHWRAYFKGPSGLSIGDVRNRKSEKHIYIYIYIYIRGHEWVTHVTSRVAAPLIYIYIYIHIHVYVYTYMITMIIISIINYYTRPCSIAVRTASFLKAHSGKMGPAPGRLELSQGIFEGKISNGSGIWDPGFESFASWDYESWPHGASQHASTHSRRAQVSRILIITSSSTTTTTTINNN